MWGATIKFTIKVGLKTEFESKAKIFLEQANANEEGIVFYDLFMDEEKTYHWIEISENKSPMRHISSKMLRKIFLSLWVLCLRASQSLKALNQFN
jgi:quinol monooxygenase YgiN